MFNNKLNFNFHILSALFLQGVGFGKHPYIWKNIEPLDKQEGLG